MWMSWLLVMISTASFLKWMHIIKVSVIVLMFIAFIVVREMTAIDSVQGMYVELLELSHNSSNITNHR